jgi:Domain of unknown function (DUF4158)
MRRLWSAEELVERWLFGPEELSLLPGKADTSKLGFAAQLAFYKQHARFPDAEADIAPAVIAHLAEQIGVPAAALAGSTGWVGAGGATVKLSSTFLSSCRSTRRPRQRSATGLRQRRCRTSQTLQRWRRKLARGSPTAVSRGSRSARRAGIPDGSQTVSTRRPGIDWAACSPMTAQLRRLRGCRLIPGVSGCRVCWPRSASLISSAR